jgi:hypothetical protein
VRRLEVRPQYHFLASADVFFTGLGTGAYKLGANYAPGVVAQRDAAKQGYVQNLWLHGPEHYLTEVRVYSLGIQGIRLCSFYCRSAL